MGTSKFSTGKKIGTELLEDILKENNNMEPIFERRIHKQRYEAILEDFDLIEFSGFLCGLAKTYMKHPIQVYQAFNSSK